MTDDEIAKLAELARNAHPGPWEYVHLSIGEGVWAYYIRTPHGALGYSPSPHKHPDPFLRLDEPTAKFIAAANPLAIESLTSTINLLRMEDSKQSARVFAKMAEDLAEAKSALRRIARRDFHCSRHQDGMAAAGLANETLEKIG